MNGHGSKLRRKLDQAVTGLLSAKNHDEAAKSIGVAPATLQRWLKLPEFEQAFREAPTRSFPPFHGPLAAGIWGGSNHVAEDHD